MAKRKMPVRTAEIELTGDYEGWKATVRTNPPWSVYELLQGGELSGIREALGELLMEPWNFVDEEGQPLGKPSPEVVMRFPLDLVNQLLGKITEVAFQLPKPPSAG